MFAVVRALAVLAVAALSISAQAQAPSGLATEWDAGVILTEISAHAGRLLPALDNLEPQYWVAKGASETYVAQLDATKQQVRAIEQGAKTLAREPEKLSPALELYFRIQAVDTMIASLQEAIRKYQTPAAAQPLASVAAEGGASRERFQQYIVTLAADREKQLDIMDREAQRCRGILSRQPAPAATSGKKN